MAAEAGMLVLYVTDAAWVAWLVLAAKTTIVIVISYLTVCHYLTRYLRKFALTRKMWPASNV